MGKGIQAVIFDLFGTLVESGDPEAEIIKTFDLKTTYKDVEKIFCGKTLPEISESYVRDLVKRVGIVESEKKLGILRNLVEKELKAVKLFPDAVPALNSLKSKDLKLGLVSNSWAPAVKKIRQEFGIHGFFDSTVLSNETGLFKPKPEAYEKCIKGLGVKAEESLMVGDSLQNDIIAPSKIGLRGILVNRGGKRVEAKEALATISGLNELPKAIKQAMQ